MPFNFPPSKYCNLVVKATSKPQKLPSQIRPKRKVKFEEPEEPQQLQDSKGYGDSDDFANVSFKEKFEDSSTQKN